LVSQALFRDKNQSSSLDSIRAPSPAAVVAGAVKEKLLGEECDFHEWSPIFIYARLS